jgi:hypothetical protein
VHRRSLTSSLESQCAPLGHGVYGIVHQIHQRAPEGGRMERHDAELLQRVQSERDAMRRECRGHFLGTLHHQHTEVQGDRLKGVHT